VIRRVRADRAGLDVGRGKEPVALVRLRLAKALIGDRGC
jgi:hypothetical protein